MLSLGLNVFHHVRRDDNVIETLQVVDQDCNKSTELSSLDSVQVKKVRDELSVEVDVVLDQNFLIGCQQLRFIQTHSS